MSARNSLTIYELRAAHDGSSLWHPKRTSVILIPLVMRCAERLRRPLVAMGVDHARFTWLLETKLTLDFRSDNKGGSGFITFGLILVMVMTWLSSLPVTLLALVHPPPEVWMAALSAHAMFMTLFLLGTMYSAILVDTTDVDVLQSRPIPDRTLFAARLAHITVYLVAILSMCLFWPIVLGWLGYPFWSLVIAVPIVVVQSATTALGIVAVVFALALRIGGPARFQRLALWSQIGITALLMGGAQASSFFMRGKPLLEWLQGDSWTRAFLPPLQQGGLYALLLGHVTRMNVAFAVLAVLVPIVSILVALALASKHFVAGLQGEIARPPATHSRRKPGIFSRLGAWCTSSRQERAGYDFVLAMSRREKLFLRATVPMLIGFASMGIVMPLNARALGDQMPGILRVLPIFLFAIGLPGILENWRFSEHGEAAWILETAPTSTLRPFVLGGIKVVLLGMLAPAVLAISVFLLAVQGIDVLPDLLVAVLLVSVLALVTVPFLVLRVPFCRKPKFGEVDFRNVAVIFSVMLVTLAAGALQALARLHWLGLLSLGVATAVGVVVAWKRLERIPEPVWV
jgi:ABC-2 type transport system permease protein